MDELSAHDDGAKLRVMLDVDAAVTVVRMSGEVDVDTSPILREAIGPVFDRPVPHTVIFDLSGVRFFDSAGLAVLLSVTRNGHTVLLRNPSEVLTRIIEATGLADVLPVEP